jgi:hypothetical protein
VLFLRGLLWLNNPRSNPKSKTCLPAGRSEIRNHCKIPLTIIKLIVNATFLFIALPKPIITAMNRSEKTNLKTIVRLSVFALIACFISFNANAQGRRFRKLPPAGQPNEIQLTPYKTTMLGDGKDTALISVKIIDRDGHEVANAQKTITFHIQGDARIIKVRNAGAQSGPDTALQVPVTGSCWLA